MAAPTAVGRGTGSRSGRRSPVGRIVGLVVLVGLVVAMVASTRFLDPQDAAQAGPQQFDPAAFATQRFPEAQKRIEEKAVDVAVFAREAGANGVNRDAAAQKYGLGSNGLFSVPLKASGTIASIDENYALITVPGLPATTRVRLPIGSQVDGTAIRDATDAIKFGDVPGQTDFLTVANELTKIEQAQVLAPADLPSLRGKKVDVVGAYQTVGPRSSILIQPVSIKVAG